MRIEDDEYVVLTTTPRKRPGLAVFMLHILGAVITLLAFVAGFPIIMNQALLPAMFSPVLALILLGVCIFILVLIYRSIYIKFWI